MNVKNLFNLEGQVALITGGGSGLGSYITQGLAESGCDVVICSRKVSSNSELIEKLQEKGVKAKAIAANITSEEDVERVVSEVIQEFGKIDILVNNSGTNWSCPVEEMPTDAWNKVMDVNLKGTFLISQKVGIEMIKRKYGRIINIASIAGIRAEPENVLDAVGYSTSKAGVIHLTKELAMKWAKHHINVNAIAPGYFETKMTGDFLKEKSDILLERIPLKRTGDKESLIGLALLLASPSISYITGQVIALDGGYTL